MQRIGLVIAGLVVTLVIAGVALRTQAHRENSEAQAVIQHTEVVTLSVPDMDCSGCEVGVKIAANKVDGVKGVKTSSETRTADVTFDPSKTNVKAIASAIREGTGFKIEVPKGRQKT